MPDPLNTEELSPISLPSHDHNEEASDDPHANVQALDENSDEIMRTNLPEIDGEIDQVQTEDKNEVESGLSNTTLAETSDPDTQSATHTNISLFSPFTTTGRLPVTRALAPLGNGLYGPLAERKNTAPMPFFDCFYELPTLHSPTTLPETQSQTGAIIEDSSLDDALLRPRITQPLDLPTYRLTDRLKRKLLNRALTRYGKMSFVGKFMLVLLLFAILLPTLVTIFAAFNTYILYKQAQSGLDHIQSIEAIFQGGSTSGTSSIAKYLDINKLRAAQIELNAAHASFVQVHNDLTQNTTFTLIGNVLPQQVSSLRALSAMAIDATTAGQNLIPSLIMLSPLVAPNLKTPFSSSLTSSGDNAQKPLLTPQITSEIQRDITVLTPLVHDMYQQSQNVVVSSLPLNGRQSGQLSKLLSFLPQIDTILPQIGASIPALDWFLGVGQPRTFLVQTMDRAELRATGGFTGQFSPLTFNGARMSQLQLKNIGPYEEIVGDQAYDATTVNKVAGKDAPAPYNSWWPIANFGMRDSNVSADFPTSAQITMHQYQYEFGSQVDGVIVFSPFLITRVLQITGPVKVPLYNETITPQNLESRLHYYQLDNAGIAKEQTIEHVSDTGQARKLFTQRLSKILIDTVEHLPSNKLLDLASQMLYSMKTKDLQIYVDNSSVENLIARYGSTSSIDRSTQHDGLYVVQDNLSANKASQYVQTYLHDTVTLDARGGATHMLQVKLVYDQLGPVYGPDTYHDYVRIYVPPSSTFLWGDGFDQGYDHPLCGGDSGLNDCPQYDVYGNGRLLCPAGMTQSGQATSTINDPYDGENHPIDKIGAPTNQQSDETGRAMYGGWLVVPKNCNLVATVSWYVPPQGQHPYSLLVQRQSSTFPILDLTILPTSAACATLKTAALYYSGVLGTTDMTFTPPVLKKTASCYPTSQP